MASSTSAAVARPLLIDMWSDFMCPYCFIGKRRLESALRGLGFEIRDAGNADTPLPTSGADDASKKIAYIRYRAFELDPNSVKVSSETITAHLSRKYGMPEAAAIANCEGIARAAAQPDVGGLVFNYKALKMSNTFDAHRVLHFAQGKGKGSAVKERLLLAYFSEGKALGDDETLASLVAECGLDAAEVSKVVADKQLFAADVRADEQAARQMRVSGVPFFLLNEKVPLSGAQDAATIAAAIAKATK